MNYMGQVIKLVRSESKPSKMPTPFQQSVVTMESATDKVKELLTPEKTTPKLSPKNSNNNNNNNNVTNTSHMEQTENK